MVSGALRAIAAHELVDDACRCRSGSASRVTTPLAAASAASMKPPVMSSVLVRGDAEVLDQPRAVLERQPVAERARDRHAEARGRRADAQIARERDRAAGAGGDAFDLRDGRHRHALEPRHARFEPPLVLDAVRRASRTP